MRVFRAVSLAITLGSASLAAVPATANDDYRVLIHQGLERSYTVTFPGSSASGPRPLVIALHGKGSSIAGLRKWLPFGAVAARENFLIAWPEAVDRNWSYGRPIVEPMPSVNGIPVDDVGFIRKVIQQLVGERRAAPDRVYVAGVSRGGMMAFTLACELSDLIAAFAPLVTGMSDHQRTACKPARAVPIIAVAGRSDRVQAYDGWIARGGRLLSIPETMEFWRSLHGCSRQTGQRMPDLDPNDRTRILRIDWLGCRDNALVRLYAVVGGGHLVPSFLPATTRWVKGFGRRSRDMDTAEELWSLFREIRR